jgi:UDP-N-acetylmuramyl pentapeptide synthase
MKYKKETCKYCGGKMKAKTTRAEFCSPNCKVYWHRENPKETLKNFNKQPNCKVYWYRENPKETLKNFNKQSNGTTKDYTEKQPETNFSINTMPKREDFESSIEFGFAKSAWKRAEQDKQ